ncbi:hybrid sensor histidine kinase/response regulator [Brevundimonas sp. Root1279]|uniref:hybrid sensor histidine kinase/response regulator n=1 Tax=Brevundimonas sp. Root1279 TaxID=1736443 RepID=UPI0007001AA9|nr:PAS domain S-box protein [Brevundimonas sp. Root1279]KQW82969.1 histidine kinase [Brevundimonas sp. Root1279]
MTREKRRDRPAETSDRYRLLVESITDYAIYMLDADGRVTSWNPGAQRFKGYCADEIIGEHFSRFYLPEDRAADLPAKALAVARREGRFESEGWRVRKDGSRFWASVVIDPIKIDGEVIGFAKITRDLSERLDAQRALQQSQEQFRLLIEGVTDYAIYMLDTSGNVASWNTGAQRIKGYRPEEIVGEHFSRFYTEEDQLAGRPAEALRIAAAEGRFEKEGLRVRKDGSRFDAHVVVDAIHDPTGRIIGYAKVTRDITERMVAQHELEAAREALFQSQKMEAVGQLTGGVAHDFNNLLAAVLGSLELVRKRLPYDPRVTPLLDNAIQGAERGAALTQRMLAFARKQELTLEPVDVAASVRGMVDFLQRTIGAALSINLRFPQRVPPVLTDQNQFESAILNLVVNARDAMPGGGVISIGAELRPAPEGRGEPGERYVCVSVSDSGEGMAADVLARASDPFFTTKGVGKGTGLGLSMVHGLVAQSGGWMEIDSAPGEGARIELWLPVALGALPAGPETPAAASAAERLVVLAVDDDNLVLTNTVAMLDDLGHEVVQASTGREALTLIESLPEIDLLITDEVMPGMTGTQLARAVSERRPNLPIIIASGYADLGLAHDRLQIGLPRLSKPFTQAELADIIAQVEAVR